MIPLSKPYITEETERLVLDVLRSGQLARGPYTEQLEKRFAHIAGVSHAVALSSGTAALEVAMVTALSPGDTVITSPFTFAATLNAAIRAGLTVIFADIADDFTLDPDAVAAAITSRTRALVPVHLYGCAANMPSLASLAATHGLTIVEDACQAVGATVDGRPVGSWGIGCFSLYATKNVAAGEGGVVTTDDPDLAGAIRVFANQGMRAPYEYAAVGTNHRITDLQSAIALPQLDHLDTLTAIRRDNAARLSAGLTGIPGLVLPVVPPGRTHVFHQYTVRVTAEARIARDALRGELARAGITTGVYYPRPVFEYRPYAECPQVVVSDVPSARRASKEVLSLPVFPGLSPTELDRIVDIVRRLLG